MTADEKFIIAQTKINQYQHQKILQDNRKRDTEERVDFRRKILVGEMFIKHFPIAMEFIPGKSSEENECIFKPLDEFMEALSECQQSFQKIENALLLPH